MSYREHRASPESLRVLTEEQAHERGFRRCYLGPCCMAVGLIAKAITRAIAALLMAIGGVVVLGVLRDLLE